MGGNLSKGFLTLVDGTQRYRRGDHYERMAKGLIRSIRQYDKDFPCAIITDSKDKELLGLADEMIRPNTKYGLGTIHKLYLDIYTPFEETIFIEPDCLLYEDPQELWTAMQTAGESVVIQRQEERRFKHGDNSFSINDMTHFLNSCGLEYIYHTIGGLIYFRQDRKAKEVFSVARDLYVKRKDLGIKKLSNQIEVADETLFATALEMKNIGTQPINDLLWQEEFKIIRKEGHGKIKVLKDEASFIRKKGAPRTLICHYSATDKFTMLYLAQLFQLAWAEKLTMYGKRPPGKVNKLLINGLSFGSSLLPYLTLKKRWMDFLWGIFVDRYKQGGLVAAIPNRIKKVLKPKT